MTDSSFTDDEIEAMRRVDANRSSEFTALVEASGLDPSEDFRFTDLRGVDFRGSDLSSFDFTGADLTGALISPSTRLPPSEHLRDAVLEFENQEDLPTIVELMRGLEMASDHSRSRLLRQLIDGYDSDVHIDRFILAQLKEKISAEAAADFFSFLSPSYQVENEATICSVLFDILKREVTRRAPSKKVGGRTPTSRISRLIAAISNSELGSASEAALRYQRGELKRDDFLQELVHGYR